MVFSKIFNWIKENVGKTISIIITLFIFLILIIHIPYWIGYKKVLIISDYSAGDILSFLGSF